MDYDSSEHQVNGHGHEKGALPNELENLGLQQETARYIGALETIAVSFSICLSWAGVAATLALVVEEGGFVTVMYGTILIFVVYTAIVGSMAELASVYPTAGGQYHWTNILAPKSFATGISYICGTINMCSWICICAGICSIIPQIILAMAIQFNPRYIPKAWHYFLVYEAFNFFIMFLNLFVMRKAMWLYTFALIGSIVTILVVIITTLARADHFQPSSVVWTDFINGSGWSSDGLVFFIGLLVPNYMYTGIDGAIHLAEECVNATVAVPRALFSTWLVGFTTAFVFVIAMIYSIQDVNVVFESLFPSYTLFIEANRSVAAATVFIVMVLVIGTITTAGCYQTASRLIWALARDNALLGAKWLRRMHPTLEAPVEAILFNTFIVFIIGCIYLGSTSAFDAIVASGVCLNMLTFVFPAAMIMLRKRSEHYLPRNRYIRLPSIVGWICNFVTATFPFLTLVFYCWPNYYPVTSSNMNYNSAVIGVMAIVAVINWFVWARTHYVGPVIRDQ